MTKIKILIMGAAGRDFHNFNTYYRDNEQYDVVAFTATQIPDIEGRVYPAVLAGKLYPNGIPIHDESELLDLIKKYSVEEVVFSYSDLPHEVVMHKAAIVNAAGPDFKMMGMTRTAVKSTKPVIGICATRTGCGKSQTTRRVAEILKDAGKQVAAIRHPMPYGDLAEQAVQRFADLDDLVKHKCTIEEMEEYEAHIKNGIVVYAGVDYEAILEEAQKEADIILWDGGNNDFSFYKADLEIVVADPHRPGHELRYHPGETNFRRAQVLVINKIDSSEKEKLDELLRNIKEFNPEAVIIRANSKIIVPEGKDIAGKTVLVIEDGPTLTHGEMPYGAGILAAQKYGASKIVDPRPFAVGSIKATYQKYTHLDRVLPALGYGKKQMAELTQTIDKVDCDLVVSGTPIDLSQLIKTNKRILRVTYELEEIGYPDLKEVLREF